MRNRQMPVCKMGGLEMIIRLLLCGLVTALFVGGVGLVLWEVAKYMAKNIGDDERFED